MAKADYKFLTDIDLESNNIVNVSKIIGNDYENISPDLEITTEDKTEGQVGNLLLRAGENEIESGYVHIYAGTSTEPSDTDTNLGIKVLPDKEIQVIDNDITIRATTTTVDEGSSITLSNNEITYHSDEHTFEDALFNVVSTSTDISGSDLINIHSANTIDISSPDTDILGTNNLTLGNAENSNYIEFAKANNNITINAIDTLNTIASKTTTIETGESTITQTPDDITIKSNNITADAGEVLEAFADTEILIQLPEENAETSIHITKYDGDSATGGLEIDSSKIDIDSTSTIDITSKSNATITAENSDLKLESKFTDEESSILLNKNITVNTGGNYNQTAAGTTGIKSTGKITVTASAGLAVIATGQLIDIDSNKLDINATESINLGIGPDNNENPSVVIGNKSITSTADTQTIKGNLITIQDSENGNNEIKLSNSDKTISIKTNDTDDDKVDITSSNINLKSDKLDSITKEFNIYLDKDGRTETSSSDTDYVKLSIADKTEGEEVTETDVSRLDINVDNIKTIAPVIDVDSTKSINANSDTLTLGNNGGDSTLSQIIIRNQAGEVNSGSVYNDNNFDILLESKNASIYSSKYLKIESAETLDIDAKKLQLNPAEDFNLNSKNIHIIGSEHLHLTNNNITEASCDTTAAGIILNKETTKDNIYINADSLTTTVGSYKLADANQSITLDSSSIEIKNSSGSIDLPKSLGDFTIEGKQAIKVIASEISLTDGNNILTVDGTNGISLSANKITTESDDTFISNSKGTYGLKVKESSNTLISDTNDIIANQINISAGTETDHTDKLTINKTTSNITNSDINISADSNLTVTAPGNFTLETSHVDIKSNNNTAESGITTQNLKVNTIANFGGFAIYWDDDINSLIFTEGELNWI